MYLLEHFPHYVKKGMITNNCTSLEQIPPSLSDATHTHYKCTCWWKKHMVIWTPLSPDWLWGPTEADTVEL